MYLNVTSLTTKQLCECLLVYEKQWELSIMLFILGYSLLSQVGDPTIIINNAGIVSGKLLLDLTEEDITK